MSSAFHRFSTWPINDSSPPASSKTIAELGGSKGREGVNERCAVDFEQHVQHMFSNTFSNYCNRMKQRHTMVSHTQDTCLLVSFTTSELLKLPTIDKDTVVKQVAPNVSPSSSSGRSPNDSARQHNYTLTQLAKMQ